jgi:hypothetical protein
MKKIFSSLRGRLTIGVIAVMLLVMAALTLVFVQLIGNLDARLFDTIKARALANANAVMGNIAFEFTAADEGSLKEAKKELKEFRNERKDEDPSISVVAQARNNDMHVGDDVSARELIKNPKL